MTKKQVLAAVEKFQGRMFFTHELCLPLRAEFPLINRHMKELGKAGKMHLIKDGGRKDSDIWCAKAEPDGFHSDAAQVRFGVREK